MTNVVLQPVDGGANYYAAYGYTQAVSAGWDDGVVPIGLWLAPMQDQTDANRWLDLGLNTAYAFTANGDLAVFTADHISAIVNSAGIIPVSCRIMALSAWCKHCWPADLR